MNDELKKQDDPGEDIDLFLLIERAILFFRRYRWVFIIAILVGLSAGYYFYRSIPKTYKSRMIVHSYFLSNQEEIQIARNWNDLLGKKEHEALSATLNCDPKIFAMVKSIKAGEIQQVFSQVNPNGFVIEAVVTDNKILPQLESALVYGFQNSPYIKERMAMKRASLAELIDKTGAEIRKLDSTKRTMEALIDGRGKTSSTLIIDGSTINRQLIEMNEKLLGFKEDLQFANAVQVLQGFEAFRRPAGPKLLPWLIIGLFISLCFAYVYALLSSINRGLKKRAKQRATIQHH